MRASILAASAFVYGAIAAPSPRPQSEHKIITNPPVSWKDVEAGQFSSAHAHSHGLGHYSLPSRGSAKRVVTTATVSPADGGQTCDAAAGHCFGDVTYYNPAGGYGACGQILQDSDIIVSLPHGMMGLLSNTNPYCGKSITIHNPKTGISQVAVVGDKCMGCTGRSIDLTIGLWNIVAPQEDGRGHGFEWWFN